MSTIELTSENIINEINNDIEKFEQNGKDCKCDKYACRFNLFQFLQLKYLNDKNNNYVGYIMHYVCQKNDNTGEIRKTYSLDNSVISTLNRANILEEIKDIKYDNYFFELLKQYYSDEMLKEIFLKIIHIENLKINAQNEDLYSLYNAIKDSDENVFKTYYKKTLKDGSLGKKDYINSEKGYFFFRFFKLSDKYAKYENELWEVLKNEFGWRLNYKIVRNF